MVESNEKSAIIVIFDINKVKWDKVEIPPEIQKRLDAKMPENREMSAAGYYAAVRAVYKLTKKLSVGYDGNKPVADGCYVSIAHTRRYAVAVASKCRVGIDIESMDRVNEETFDRIADKKAKNAHESLEGEERRFDRAKYWCMSEAYFKCTGKLDFSTDNVSKFAQQTLTVGDCLVAVVGDGVETASAWF